MIASETNTTPPANTGIPRPGYKILKDQVKDNYLIENGYVVLDILNHEQVAFFKELYHKWHPTPPDSFYKSYFSNNLEYKKEVEDAIMQYCLPVISEQFYDFNAFGAMFVVKPKGDSGHIPPHQDWSFVDETQHWSLNMWLPIQDVEERSGTMRFLKGSHFFLETIRGANTPELYNHLEEPIMNNLVDVPLKAGQAVFFYHGIVHCSHFNERNEERVCLGLSLTQKEAPIYFHYLKESETMAEKFCVQPSFFLYYAHNRHLAPENATSMGIDTRPFAKLSAEQLLEKINHTKPIMQ
ncbi:MAG TPA: phytanoyl-CoA dioxygenase family protein [Chitinophagales bacterium]|nr:phytanoyl-CoA dioxygenase family protein [Chitinophagales bacterium]